MDFDGLRAQTFGDVRLEAELLTLFLDQARRLVPSLPGLGAADRIAALHLLKGSALAIGAVSMAAAIAACERRETTPRRVGAAIATLGRTFAETERVVLQRLWAIQSAAPRDATIRLP